MYTVLMVCMGERENGNVLWQGCSIAEAKIVSPNFVSEKWKPPNYWEKLRYFAETTCKTSSQWFSRSCGAAGGTFINHSVGQWEPNHTNHDAEANKCFRNWGFLLRKNPVGLFGDLTLLMKIKEQSAEGTLEIWSHGRKSTRMSREILHQEL